MKNKILLMLGLLVCFSMLAVFVNAITFSTTEFENPNAALADVTTTRAFKVTYDITKPGWYLLPSTASVPSFAEESLSVLEGFYKATAYKYIFSPFTKEYVFCDERKAGVNPLFCDEEKLFDKPISYLEGLDKGELARRYLAFFGNAADWHYLTTTGKISYEYQPFNIFDYDDRDVEQTKTVSVGLLGSKLKKGWNIITYPPYLAYGVLKLGDCKIEKMYGFNDEEQKWIPVPQDKFVDEEYSGGGFAVKVSEDCTFLALKPKASSVAPPPSIPE